jgi:AP-1 complex subunit gamma-1
MSLRLRELIKAVRACKTAEEERTVIARETAAIRTSIKEEDNLARPRNVAKLLYINMLGYSTLFGQMECLKLIASPLYSDKRIGYLGLMVLLDENQEVLMLVTNSLKNDLQHVNQYVVGLALCALGDIGSAEICRDCAPEVEKLLSSSNPYLRKKAALAAVRIIRKVPDLAENFVPKLRSLLTDRNHGALLAVVTLMTQLCESFPAHIETLRNQDIVKTLVNLLKVLVQSGYSPEYDVCGITDPFLQIRILRLLRLLGAGNSEASDLMNDVLAQIATNTDTMRNVGNAILYECVKTIMAIESESGLRVLAINILGRFLSNREANIRYVALNLLCQVVGVDTDAVQKHRNTIVDCLKDPDISIRRRALELIYALVNEQNVKSLVRELLNYLLVADLEFRADLTAKICLVTEKYAPTKRWHIDTIIRVMSIAGQYVSEEVASNLISIIVQTPELHLYAVQKMYLALLKDTSQQALVRAAVWCIGEFGELLVNSKTPSPSPSSSANDEESVESIKVTEEDVLNLLHSILKNPVTSPLTKRYTLTALVKLSTRFSAASQETLRKMIQKYQGSINVELQQRACEYNVMLGLDPNLRTKILDKIPAPIRPEITQTTGTTAKATENANKAPKDTKSQQANGPQQSQAGTKETLIDFGLDIGTQRNAAPTTAEPKKSTSDILAEIFDAKTSPTPPPTASLPTVPLIPVAPVSGAFGQAPVVTPNVTPAITTPIAMAPTTVATVPIVTSSTFPPLTVFNADGITIVFEFSKPNPQRLDYTAINAVITNSNSVPVLNFQLQAAVPKYIKIQLDPASASTIPPNNSGKVTQLIKLANSAHGEKPILMKLKVEYSLNDKQQSQLVAISNFPSGL